MKVIEKKGHKQAIEVIKSCLSKVPFVKIESIEDEWKEAGSAPDLLLKLLLPYGKYNLIVEIRNNGQPRLAREVVNQILRYQMGNPYVYGVFVAPYISARSAEICRQEGIGYIDYAGNCYFSFGAIYININNFPNPNITKRETHNLYSPKSERILRILLNSYPRYWKFQELVKEADVSFGKISNIKSLLIDREWLIVREEGMTLKNPDVVLSDWAINYSQRKAIKTEFYLSKNIQETEAFMSETFQKLGIQYGFTSFSGAARLAPFVRYNKINCYILSKNDLLPSTIGLKRVNSGGNINLITPKDEGVLYGLKEVEGCHIVSPIQIYLDLLLSHARGEEAANFLLENIIKPKWSHN